jgi:hypothetical protein
LRFDLLLSYLDSRLRFLASLSVPRVVGAILGNSHDLRQQLAERDRYVAKLEALLDEERDERRKLQDRLLQRHGLSPVYEAPGPPPERNPQSITVEELVQRDQRVEVEELAMRAASDAFYMRYVEEAASVDEQWRPVLKRALEMSHG